MPIKLLTRRDRVRINKQEEEKKHEREREKVLYNHSFCWFYHCIHLGILVSLTYLIHLLQERIRAGKELLEVKRIAEENERQRFVLILHI